VLERALPLALLALAAGAGGCHASNAAGAVAITSLAGGVSAVRRANGACYVDCLPGSRCNHETGLCDPLACAGNCASGFVCEETETGSACVPREQSALAVSQPPVVPSGAQPFGDGQAAQAPTGAAAISGAASSGNGGPGLAGRSTASADGGVVLRAPAAALPAGPTAAPSGNAASPSGPAGPFLDGNPWDPHHADPVPQMDNPNLPPPH